MIERKTYLATVVEVHNTAPRCSDILVTLCLSSHDQSSIHVHVMAGQVQRNQSLKDHAVCGLRCRQKDQQASGRAAISDHVQHSSKPSALFIFSCSDSVERIQQTGNRVKEAAASRMQRHEV